MTGHFRAKVVGSGHYVPEHIVTNDDMAKIVDTNDEWIQTRTGIKTRHLIQNNEIGLRGWPRWLHGVRSRMQG